MFFFSLGTWFFLRCQLLLFFLLVQEQSKKRHLILVSGFIHDVRSFIDEHPGGPHLLIKMIGKDATTAFFGGVYDHSNAAHNVGCTFRLSALFTLMISTTYLYLYQLLAMKRVGILHGGTVQGLDDKTVPPSQRLKIARYDEVGSPYGSSTAYSDGEGILG